MYHLKQHRKDDTDLTMKQRAQRATRATKAIAKTKKQVRQIGISQLTAAESFLLLMLTELIIHKPSGNHFASML